MNGALALLHPGLARAKSVRASISLVDASVEGKPPTAFRIWRAGANDTDHGTHIFTERSAEILIATQAIRGNRFSIDVDHLSLSKGAEAAPPEARKAVGWHELEVRDGDGGPELWAVRVEWTAAVAAGLAADPPEWRYFSPAYDVDPETDEIIRYLNTALTNNPATWNVTTLASVASSKEERGMTHEEILAALKKMAEGEDEDGKKAKATLAALEPGGDEPKKDEPKKDAEDAPPPDEKKESVAASTDEEDAPAPPSDEKKAAVAVAASVKPGVDVELAKLVGALAGDVAALKSGDRKAKRTSILASRTDLPSSLLAVLSKSKLETVERITASIPKPKGKNLAAVEQPAVLAAAPVGDKSKTGRAVDANVKATIDRKMGLVPISGGIVKKDNVLTLGTLGADEARSKIADKNKGAGASGKVA